MLPPAITNRLSQIKFRDKLGWGFAIPILFLIVVAVIGIVTTQTTREAFQTVTQVNLPLVTALEEMKFAGSRLISSTNEYVLDSNLEVDGEAGEAG
jgi:CHASE3 domain sensor protein